MQQSYLFVNMKFVEIKRGVKGGVGGDEKSCDDSRAECLVLCMLNETNRVGCTNI